MTTTPHSEDKLLVAMLQRSFIRTGAEGFSLPL